MKETIDFAVGSEQYSIPNSWKLLSTAQYIGIIHDTLEMRLGTISPAMVRINHVCRCMGWDLKEIKGQDALANLALLGSQVTFLFLISYPDNDLALMDLSAEDRERFKRIAPQYINHPLGRYLDKQPYHYVLDSCFCAQLIPKLRIDGATYQGYTINSDFDALTCSLTALQYIEARDLITQPDKLPLMASILYQAQPYQSAKAHLAASEFAQMPKDTLQAIHFNFIAFNNYLMTRTPFKLLTEGSATSQATISTGAIESLYNLSADGYGDVNTIEQINLITYLTIMRKKLIEVVRTMHASDTKIADIVTKTGLPYHIINQIIA